MTAAIEVRERPIPFTAEMVRAILEGRKTQTRRVMKVQPTPPVGYVYVTSDGHALFFQGTTVESPPCDLDHKIPKSPYGVKSDKLWVKETYGSATCLTDDPYVYKADSKDGTCPACHEARRWKSGRFMHKLAARLWLEVTDLRVERLQAISEEDSIAEGLRCATKDGKLYKYGFGDMAWMDWDVNPVKIYSQLWDSINKDRPGCRWEDNPMIWVISFRRIER
jgi:hypothetical protein